MLKLKSLKQKLNGFRSIFRKMKIADKRRINDPGFLIFQRNNYFASGKMIKQLEMKLIDGESKGISKMR